MRQDQWQTEQFEHNRAHLLEVARRMLGSAAEAEDAVQEAWLRFSRTDTDEVDNMRGWLTTVVSRICLDLLRARQARREELVDGWLPEPVLTVDLSTDPSRPGSLSDFGLDDRPIRQSTPLADSACPSTDADRYSA